MREKKKDVKQDSGNEPPAPASAEPESDTASTPEAAAALASEPGNGTLALEAPAAESVPDDAAKPTSEAGGVERSPADAGAPSVAAPAPALTTEQFDALRARAAKADEYWDRLLRVSADFENFKKRAARERQEAINFANQNLLQRLLPAMDNFDAALAATKNDGDPAVEALKRGVALIQSQLRAVLAEAGLEEIDAMGKPFDPNLHEAVAQQESADQPEGQVLQQLRKGYKLRERLIRPASVVVAKKPAGG